MLNMEWDWDTALRVREEEGREKGRIEVFNECLALLDKGYTAEDLKRELKARV